MTAIALPARPATTFVATEDLTATEPPERRGLGRDGVRLLVADRTGVRHTRFARIDRELRPGDVVVVNTSATVPGELDGRRDGRPVVVHVANALPDGSRVVELRSAPDAAAPLLDAVAQERIELPAGGSVTLTAPYPAQGSSPTGHGNRLWRGWVGLPGPGGVSPRRVRDYLDRHARPISYGYLSGRFPITAYQTVFARHPGSAEMPSAGRPFSHALVTRLLAGGVIFAPITLHTSVSSQDAGELPLDEWFSVPETTAQLVNSARARGSRVVAVGTTATRALESAAGRDGRLAARSGWTGLVISPDRPVRVVDGLITGWHHPEASHLLLVESVAGPALTQLAYDAAVAERYRWHEFGDSGLLLP